MPEPDLVSLFVRPLNHLDPTYMVTGAVEAIIYGEPRLTRDIDLVVELSAADASRPARTFPPEDSYSPPEQVIRDEVQRRIHGHFNLIHHKTSLKADVYVLGDDALHHWGFREGGK